MYNVKAELRSHHMIVPLFKIKGTNIKRLFKIIGKERIKNFNLEQAERVYVQYIISKIHPDERYFSLSSVKFVPNKCSISDIPRLPAFKMKKGSELEKVCGLVNDLAESLYFNKSMDIGEVLYVAFGNIANDVYFKGLEKDYDYYKYNYPSFTDMSDEDKAKAEAEIEEIADSLYIKISSIQEAARHTIKKETIVEDFLEAIEFLKESNLVNLYLPTLDIILMEDADKLAETLLDKTTIEKYKGLKCSLRYNLRNHDDFLDNIIVDFRRDDTDEEYKIVLNDYSIKFRENILTPKCEFLAATFSKLHTLAKVCMLVGRERIFNFTLNEDFDNFMKLVDLYATEVFLLSLNFTDIKVMIDYLYKLGDEN